MKVAVTIPAFNEEKNIGDVITSIQKVMSETDFDYFIHVQNDGSTDDTVKICVEKGCIVHSNPRRMGLAHTFREEVRNCLALGAEVIVHVDADGQYGVRALPAMLAEIVNGADLVVGSRFIKGGRPKIPKIKMYCNILFSIFLNLIFRTRVGDMTSGFRAFTKDTAREVEITTSYTYTHQQIIKATRLNKKIVEVPVDSYPTRDSKLSKNVLEYAVKSLVDLFKSK